MYKFVDLVGQRFGERVVIGLSHQHPKSGNYYWNVVCNCGREDKVTASRLKTTVRCVACSGRHNGRKGLYTKAENLPCYFIKCGDYVKVGSSANPKRRLKDLQSDNPYPLTLLWVDIIHNERYWHEKLQSCHHRGEWYHFNKVLEIVDLT